MSYYEHFRENYDEQMRQIEARRQDVINRTRAFSPDNLDELLAASEDGEVDYDLSWVDVLNPWQSEKGGTITVKPILSCTAGYPDTEREKDRSDKGVWKLGIEARLPKGDNWYMGDIMFSYAEGQPKNEPMITINIGFEIHSFGTYTRWDSADAELFLRLAESALAAQPHQE